MDGNPPRENQQQGIQGNYSGRRDKNKDLQTGGLFIMKRLFLFFLLIACGKNSLGIAEANPLTPKEAAEVILWGCLHPDSIDINTDETNLMLLSNICDFAMSKNRLVIITSNCRDSNPNSFHYTCNAIDWYLDYGLNMDECEVLQIYRHDIIDRIDWLNKTGRWERGGHAVYPFKLIHHDDIDRHKRLWGFAEDDSQITFSAAMDLLDERIVKECF